MRFALPFAAAGFRVFGGGLPHFHSDNTKFSLPVNAGTKEESVGMTIDQTTLPVDF